MLHLDKNISILLTHTDHQLILIENVGEPVLRL